MNKIYHLFSSPASLPIISFLALLAVSATFISDRKKTIDFRNSKILELREIYFDKVLTNIDVTISRIVSRADSLLNSLDCALEGKRFQTFDAEWFKNDELTPKLSQDVSSESLKNLYGSIVNILLTLNISCNAIGLSEPDSSRNSKETEHVNYTEAERNQLEIWRRDINNFVGILHDSRNLLYKQYSEEVARLQPKDTWKHRREDRIQVKQNKKILKQLNRS